MNVPKQFKFTLAILGLLAVAVFVFKVNMLVESKSTFTADEVYKVTYRYFFKTDSTDTFIKAYLPKNNARQQIVGQKSTMPPSIKFTAAADDNNLRGSWITEIKNSYESISYSFSYKGKEQFFGLTEYFKSLPDGMEPYLTGTKNIQVDALAIDELASRLKRGNSTDKQKIQALFDYVNAIPSAPIITLTDALGALERNEASCNGKSRLLVALARNMGYPARIKGGIVLKESNKRTSHAWAEIYINNNWVPFDALNGHFAYLPTFYIRLEKIVLSEVSRKAIMFSINIFNVRETNIFQCENEFFHVYGMLLVFKIPRLKNCNPKFRSEN